MKKIGRKPTDDQLLEGGGGGGGFRSIPSSVLNPRPTGSRSAKDYNEKEKEKEFFGEMRFGSPKGKNYDSGDRTPRTSDDYAKGGSTFGRPGDEKTLEGGGSGGGNKTRNQKISMLDMAPAAGMTAIAAGYYPASKYVANKKDAADREAEAEMKRETRGKAKGGAVKMAKGGSVSARADGCAQRGKTKGRIV